MKPLLFLIALTAAHAQPLAFDAAAIKPTGTPNGNSSMRLTAGRITMENVSLRKLILRAWGIPDDRTWAITGPDFLATDSFDLQATFAPGIPVAQLQTMLQALLAERFHLTLHKETRQLPHFTLLAAKSGPTLKPSTEGQSRTTGAPGHLVATSTTMAKLADLLSKQAGLPVTDATGLTGPYDFTLTWSPTEGFTPDAAGSIDAPALFTALREQLGLRLEPGKGPVEVLVIDHIEKLPTAN